MDLFRHRIKKFEIAFADRWNGPITRRAQISTGSMMFIVLPDRISSCLYLKGYFEPEVAQFMQYVLKPGQTAIDVGAHFGLYTLIADDIVGPSGTVIAFEPTTKSRKILLHNCQGRPNIIVSKLAVDQESGRVLHFQDLGWKYGASNSAGEPRLKPKAKAQVRNVTSFIARTTSIDDYVRGNKIKPSLLKLDCEGWEMHTLLGATQTLQQFKPAVIFESGDRARNSENNTIACINYLTNLGYSIFEYNKGRVKRHQKRIHYPENGNLLALRNNHHSATN